MFWDNTVLNQFRSDSKRCQSTYPQLCERGFPLHCENSGRKFSLKSHRYQLTLPAIKWEYPMIPSFCSIAALPVHSSMVVLFFRHMPINGTILDSQVSTNVKKSSLKEQPCFVLLNSQGRGKMIFLTSQHASMSPAGSQAIITGAVRGPPSRYYSWAQLSLDCHFFILLLDLCILLLEMNNYLVFKSQIQ